MTEGILYALPPEASDALLDGVAALSAPGSTLAFDHGQDSPSLRAARAAISPTLVPLWRGGPSQDLQTWLRQRGWEPDIHDIADIAAAYQRPSPPAFAYTDGRSGHGWLATATKIA